MIPCIWICMSLGKCKCKCKCNFASIMVDPRNFQRKRSLLFDSDIGRSTAESGMGAVLLMQKKNVRIPAELVSNIEDFVSDLLVLSQLHRFLLDSWFFFVWIWSGQNRSTRSKVVLLGRQPRRYFTSQSHQGRFHFNLVRTWITFVTIIIFLFHPPCNWCEFFYRNLQRFSLLH